MGEIRVGVGGWTYEPWRGGVFYPKGLPQAQELAHASRALTAIEINGTYYSTFKPASFAKWRAETPDNFVFTLKAHRFATNRRMLAEAGPSIAHFIGSGIAELGSRKLGPIVWQFMPTKRFDAADFGAFLALLPKEVGGIALRHAVEVRHGSFACAEFVDLARQHGVATVFTDSDDYASFADVTGDFVYVRTMRSRAELPAGYSDTELDAIAASARAWAAGAEPAAPRVAAPPAPRPRDVFVFFISAAKERNPAAAQALIARL
jgi:uncharacterized protein YecE (DUF72 family)